MTGAHALVCPQELACPQDDTGDEQGLLQLGAEAQDGAAEHDELHDDWALQPFDAPHRPNRPALADDEAKLPTTTVINIKTKRMKSASKES